MERRWYIGNSREKLMKVCSLLAQFLVKPEHDWELVLREHRKARGRRQRRHHLHQREAFARERSA